MDSQTLEERLQFALSVALEAQELILGYYQKVDLNVDLKADESPVTAADKGAEQLIRDRLAVTFPDDGILGEEFGTLDSKNGYRWILDPVDGTKPFVQGVPLFGTLIGLEYDSRTVLGVARFPALNEVVYAADGLGTWWQIGDAEPRRTTVSETGDLSQSVFCFTEPQRFARIGRPEVLETLMKKCRMSRGWGDCYGHILVATGRAEVMIDPELSPWDAAALVPIVREAGGSWLDWNGEETIYSGNGFSVNAALKAEILDLLKK
ncbi:MAG: histidinol-phosphatase [Planctomycetaceae bacterium]|nr:histidinol-phosphatase [bacterium]MDB4786811.1 histidinol-phosphatase [Planctomycetaceae bacterium]MDC0273099.1 histidinol-phosphatase [Planctomycetaceae bacterium]MDG2389179.1 histidinol-phosphatase [Planctomycetaceae bacterium]